MKIFTCSKCKEVYSGEYKTCPLCEDAPGEVVLPRKYSVPFFRIFRWFLLLPMIALLISLQLNLIFRNGFSWMYLILMAVESYFLVRMTTLIRLNLASIIVTDSDITRSELYPPKKTILPWARIKRFKFRSAVSTGSTTKIYIIESKKGDSIAFNTLYGDSLELVELIKGKGKVKLKKSR
jgi:hypothetical protein